MRTQIVSAFLMILTALAGCSEDAAPPAQAEDDLGFEQPLEATKDTGIIRGVVLDPAVVPIAGADVKIISLSKSTVTNQNGAFGFSELEPGTYFLEVSKPGFAKSQTSASVVANVNSPPVIKVQLIPDPSTAPFVDPHQFNGYLRCSLSYIALCGVSPALTGDNFLTTFDIAGNASWINMEAVWESTQPTGDQLNMNMGRTPAGPGTTCCTAQGGSPLLITANQTTVTEGGIGTEGQLVHRMFAWEIEGTGIDDHTGQCVYVVLTTYCQGPGAVVDQTYEVFVHAFYRWVPEEGWRFTGDGSPEPPQ